MDKKEKELLLKTEFCNRLPYGLKCLVDIDATEFDEFTGKDIGFKGKAVGELYLVDVNDNHVELYFEGDDPVSNELSDMSMEGLLTIDDCQPYLRPMSSLTKEEKQYYDISLDLGYAEAYNEEIYTATKMIDFFSSHHLDNRNLIEKGLALEAPEGMYKI